MTDAIVKCAYVEIVDNDDMRVVIDYDAVNGNHSVKWQFDPDFFDSTFRRSGSISVGELRHALAVCAVVVDALTRKVEVPDSNSHRFEMFDVLWDRFSSRWLDDAASVI